MFIKYDGGISRKGRNKTYNILRGSIIMQNCEFVTMISILACTIAKDKTQEELGILSAFFTQLRRYISNTFSTRYKERIANELLWKYKKFLDKR